MPIGNLRPPKTQAKIYKLSLKIKFDIYLDKTYQSLKTLMLLIKMPILGLLSFNNPIFIICSLVNFAFSLRTNLCGDFILNLIVETMLSIFFVHIIYPY